MLLLSMKHDEGWSRIRRFVTRMPRLRRDLGAHPVWLVFFVLGRVPAARWIAQKLVAATHRPKDAVAEPDERFAAWDPVSVATTVRTNGIATGVDLPADVVARIRAYAEANICYGGPNWTTPFTVDGHAEAERQHGCKLLVGSLPEPARNCPEVAELTRNRCIHDIAAQYLRAQPQLIDVRLWWSFPSQAPSRGDLSLAAQESFHFDLADWHQLKFFFYITDVDERRGPHRYVRGSHTRRPLRHHFPLFSAKTDQQIISAYGSEAVCTVTGPAGTGFVEDPFGYHTGTLVTEGRRLVLEISFGISNVVRHVRRPSV
jgi:hypothetical protein